MHVRRSTAALTLLVILACAGCGARASTQGASGIRSPSMTDPPPRGSVYSDSKQYLQYSP